MAYKLTPLGEMRARRIDAAKEPENAVMVYMYETRDPVEIEEIAGETRMSDESTERVVARLGSKGYVKEV